MSDPSNPRKSGLRPKLRPAETPSDSKVRPMDLPTRPAPGFIRTEMMDEAPADTLRRDSLHTKLITRFMTELVLLLGRDYSVRVRAPLWVDVVDPPVPEIAVMTRAEEDAAFPQPRSALFVLDIVDGTVEVNRIVRARQFARAGVAEYCLVTLGRKRFELLATPDVRKGLYRSNTLFQKSDVFKSAVLPKLQVKLSSMFA